MVRFRARLKSSHELSPHFRALSAESAGIMSGGLSHVAAVQAPHGVSSFDLVKHAARAEAPAGRSNSDPVRVLLDFFHGRDSAKVSGVWHID